MQVTIALARILGQPSISNHLKNNTISSKCFGKVRNIFRNFQLRFSTIYMGLENAARTLAYSLSSETVNIVGHKYGSEVGEVVGNAVFSIGNLALTTHNVQSLGVKSVAKRTAKDAGKAVLKDYTEHVPKE